MEYINRFFRRIKFSYKRDSIISDWRTYLMVDLSLPILQMLCYSLIAYYAYGSEKVSRWMIGNSLLVVAFTAIYRVGFLLSSEKYNGTLSLLVASKTKLWEISFTSAFSTIIQSLLSVFIGVTVISLLLHIPWTTSKVTAFLLVLLIAVFVSMSFGFLFSCFILVSTEVHLVTNTASQILLIFTGANFPISSLPKVFQFIPPILPLTRSISVAQSIMDGNMQVGFLNPLKAEMILGFIYLLIAVVVLHTMEKVAIKNGSLDML